MTWSRLRQACFNLGDLRLVADGEVDGLDRTNLLQPDSGSGILPAFAVAGARKSRVRGVGSFRLGWTSMRSGFPIP